MKTFFAGIGIVAILVLLGYGGYRFWSWRVEVASAEAYQLGLREGAGVGPNDPLPQPGELDAPIDDMQRIRELNIFLDRCGAVYPEYRRLHEILQKADNELRFGHDRFRTGEAYALSKYWYDNKFYILPFNLESVASRRLEVNRIATAIQAGTAVPTDLEALAAHHFEVGNFWLGIPWDQSTGKFRRDLVATHPKAPEVMVEKFKTIADFAVPGWSNPANTPEPVRPRQEPPPPPQPGIEARSASSVALRL